MSALTQGAFHGAEIVQMARFNVLGSSTIRQKREILRSVTRILQNLWLDVLWSAANSIGFISTLQLFCKTKVNKFNVASDRT